MSAPLITILDDEAGVRQVLSDALEEAGFQTMGFGRATEFEAALRRRRRPVILAGDLNIARSELDIFHWRSNRDTSGFLPHERTWMNDMVASGWHDMVREHAGDVDGPYTWWSNRGQARILDRGWRIDYVLVNPAGHDRVKSVHVDREAGLEVSDHGPVLIELE